MHDRAAPLRMSARRKRCTCHLLRRLTRRVTQAYDHALAPAGLTITQYSLLAHARRQPASSVAALAAAMGMDRTTLLRTLKPVVAAGWVRYGERRTGRSASLELTAAGEARLRTARPHWSRAQEAIDSALSSRRVARLHALLDEALEALNGKAAA